LFEPKASLMEAAIETGHKTAGSAGA
jgi:hypothetical protein